MLNNIRFLTIKQLQIILEHNMRKEHFSRSRGKESPRARMHPVSKAKVVVTGRNQLRPVLLARLCPQLQEPVPVEFSRVVVHGVGPHVVAGY